MYVPNDSSIYYTTFQKLLDAEEEFPSNTYLIIDESHIYCKEKVRKKRILPACFRISKVSICMILR